MNKDVDKKNNYDKEKNNREKIENRDKTNLKNIKKIMINLNNLDVGYGKRVVVGGINLDVKMGEIVTLIGPNGSGKSTILKSIANQIRILGGNIQICGKNLKEMNDSTVAKHLSIVLTNRLKTEMMTCREVVATGRYPYTGRFGILSSSDWDVVDEAIDMFNAREVADKNFMEVSDGQKQRVMLARALCQEPDVLILDEPTSFLDLRYKLDILHRLRTIVKKKKISVVMSLHELDLAQKISDKIVCVKNDVIHKIGEPEDIFVGDYIKKLYGIELGSYEVSLGIAKFPKAKGEPRIFVIGAGGKNVELYYKLQRDEMPFATGIVRENDVEYYVAKDMANAMISAKPFEIIDRKLVNEAMRIIDNVEVVLCKNEYFGPLNEENKLLMEYAKKLKKI